MTSDARRRVRSRSYLRASGRIDLSAVAWDRIGERRHFAFYRAQARMRLARSARARRVTRWVMEHLWDPVGTGVRPQQETDFVLASLFGDERGLAEVRRVDATVSALPGLEGLKLLEDAREKALARLPRSQVPAFATTAALANAGVVSKPA